MAVDSERGGRALVGFAVVGSVAPLTPAALDETMLVKMVLVVAVMLVFASWWFAGLVTHQGSTWFRGGLPTALAVFAVAVVAATAWSSDPAASFVGSYERYSGTVGYLAYAGLALAVLRWFPGRPDQVIGWVLGGSIAVVAYGLAQMSGLDPVRWSGRFGDDVIAQFGNPDFVSGYVGMIFPLALWAAVWSGWATAVRSVAAVLSVALVVVLVGAGAVQGGIAAGAGLLVLAVGSAAASGRRTRPIVAGGGALLASGLGVALAGLAGIGPLSGSWGAGTARSRRYLWETALEMIRAEPVTGVGLDRYGRYYHAFRPLDEAVRRDLDQAADAAHNVFLNLAAGGGLPLALAWFALAVVAAIALGRGWQRGDVARRRLVAALGAAYLAYHVQAFVSLDVPPLAATGFVLLGAIGAVSGTTTRRRFGQPPDPRRRVRRVWVTAGLAVPSVVILAVVLWADGLAGRAGRAAEEGDLERAAGAAAGAVELAPWQPAYHFERARVLAYGAQLEAALDAMDEVIRRDRRDLAAWISRGRLLKALDRPLAAVEAYGEARRLAPKSPELGVEYAEALADVGQSGQARSVLVEVLTLVPGFGPAEELLVELDRGG